MSSFDGKVQVTSNDGTLDVTGDGGVLLKLTTRGVEDGECPEDGDTIAVNYVGRVLGEEDEFDRNHGGYPFEFKIGESKVVRGWELAAVFLRIGDIGVLTISPEYGFGDGGSGDEVPPKSTLVFTIELVAIKERIKGSGASDRERLAELRAEREVAELAAKEKKAEVAKKSLETKSALAEKLANKNKKGGGVKVEKKEWKAPVKKEKPVKKVKKGKADAVVAEADADAAAASEPLVAAPEADAQAA